MARRSKFFEIEFDPPTRSPVAFLDLELSFRRRSHVQSIISYRVVPKATSIAMPLSASSMHGKGVHRSWPVSLLKRATSLCSDLQEAEREQNRRRAEWSRVNIFPAVGPMRDRSIERPACIAEHRVARLILPYTFIWGKAGLAKIISGMQLRWSSEFRDSGVGTTVGISWRLGGKHLANCIRATNWVVHSNPESWRIFRSFRRCSGGSRGW